MAEIRKSGKQVAARKAARERAVERSAEFRRRHEQLESLAVEYFVLSDALEGISESAELEIQMIRDRAAKEAAETAAKADEIVQRMLATKITRDEVAERLGIPVREVRRTSTKTSATVAAFAGDEDPSEKEASISNDAQSADAA
jgi:hypothetical protein